MKVLMIAPQPFFQPRGTPFSVLHRLRALSELGHEVDLATYPIGEDRQVPRVKILRAPTMLGIDSVKVGPSLKKFPLDLRLFAHAWRQLGRERYDMVHTHEEACFLGAWISRRRGIPHLYDMHSSLPQQLENYGFLAYKPVLWLGRALERWVLRNSRGVIAICDALRDLALAQGATPERLFLIHNRPVDDGPPPGAEQVREFAARFGGRPVILYTGTFERNQGLELLIDAFRPLAGEGTDALLCLVGGTAEQCARLAAHARELGGSVQIVERRPVEEMALWTAAATVLCSPRTHGTNTPLKIYSYLAAGKPILATDLWTHRQVLDDRTALLVPPTQAGLAEGLRQLVREPALRESLSQAAREASEERYSSGKYLEKHRQMFASLFP